MTNEMKVMRYIAEHGSISVHEAVSELWINSLTKVISNMRKKGTPITDWTVTTKDGKRFKRYGL